MCTFIASRLADFIRLAVETKISSVALKMEELGYVDDALQNEVGKEETVLFNVAQKFPSMKNLNNFIAGKEEFVATLRNSDWSRSTISKKDDVLSYILNKEDADVAQIRTFKDRSLFKSNQFSDMLGYLGEKSLVDVNTFQLLFHLLLNQLIKSN